MSIRVIQPNFRILMAVAAGLIFMAALAIGLTLLWLRSEAIHEAYRNAGNLATVLAEQINHSVQSIDLMHNQLQEQIEVLGARTPNDFRRLLQGEDIYKLLTERKMHLSHVASISLTDKNGWMVSSTNKWPLPPTDLSAREHFQYFKNNNDKGIYVTSPVGDRFKGIQTIYFAKRINDTNNEFLGMITIGVQLSYFKHIYESITSMHNLSFLFLRKDGTVIVRYPDEKDRTGEKMPAASPWYQLVLQGGGYYRSPGYFDGIARQSAVRPLSNYNLVINVAVSETDTLANWRIQTITIGIGTLLFLISSVFLLRSLSNQFHRLTTSKAALVEKANELEHTRSALYLQNQRFDVALNNMAYGLIMYDAAYSIVVCNRQYIEMYGLLPEVVKPGCEFRELIEHRKARGSFTGDVDEYCARILAGVATGNTLDHVTETPNGRIIHILNRPMENGGRVSMHLDITERRRMEAEIIAQHQHLDTALNNMSQGLCMFDAEKRLVVCNDRYAKMYHLPPELLKPGTSHNAIITHRVSHGILKGEKSDNAAHEKISDLSQLSACARSSRIDELSDGRLICVTREPMAGGGWVATHEDITEQKQAEARIARMAHFDALTDLPNRVTFNNTMNAMIDHAGATGKRFAVLSIDLDHFKEANDSFGHLIGDALLYEVARRLQAAAGEIFLARIGGDEFVLIAADGPQPATASALADHLLATFVDDFEVEGHRLKLGMSIGVAIYPTDGTDAKTLMINADATLYRAKAEFRGSALFFEPEMSVRLHERRTLQKDLRSAIDRGELLLHYQPQMKMSGETIGFEALVRWQCSNRGMVLPRTFIPVAEESNLIIQIGEWVLREACREAVSWPQPLTIAVNISPVQFRLGDLPKLVHTVLLETGLAPGRLELEITESVMINDFSRAVSILRRLKSLGVRIAMDDFGTGYSSLSYLQSFRCDKIKIDRIFICDLEHNYHSRAIVRAIVGLGRSLNLPILAEGVETEAQHAYLVQEGCDEVQGYLTGRPQPIADYAKLVGRQTTVQQSYAVAG